MLEPKSGFSGFCFYNELSYLPNYTNFTGFASFVQLADCNFNAWIESWLNTPNRPFALQFCSEHKPIALPGSVKQAQIWNPCIVSLLYSGIKTNSSTIYTSWFSGFAGYWLPILMLHFAWVALNYLLKVGGLDGLTLKEFGVRSCILKI